MSSENINTSTKELKFLDVSFLFLFLSNYYLAADSGFFKFSLVFVITRLFLKITKKVFLPEGNRLQLNLSYTREIPQLLNSVVSA